MNLIQFDEINRTWHSYEKLYDYNENDSIGQILFDALSCTNKSYVIQINATDRTEFTNNQVLSMSSNIALEMQSMGIEQSDVIGIMAFETSYIMPVCFAAFFIGTPFQCIEASLDKESVFNLWNITKPKLVFCDNAVYDIVKEVSHQLNLNCAIITLSDHKQNVTSIQTILSNKKKENKIFRPALISDLDATAVLCCSSGSSGPQKAVCWSHRFIKMYCLPLL